MIVRQFCHGYYPAALRLGLLCWGARVVERYSRFDGRMETGGDVPFLVGLAWTRRGALRKADREIVSRGLPRYRSPFLVAEGASS